MGGVEKRGGWKTSRMTPPPKKGCHWTPPRTVRFHPPQVSVLCFACTKSTTEKTRSSFGGVQKFLGERVLWYVFLPPYVLHPPYHGPKSLAASFYSSEGHIRTFLHLYLPVVLSILRTNFWVTASIFRGGGMVNKHFMGSSWDFLGMLFMCPAQGMQKKKT